tara:strand:- start:2675 stop:2926 length:252 start_codon:yes stop_codon:yes gene_type:complete
MSLIPKQLPYVAHPFISSVYLKEDYSKGFRHDKTLIVEVNLNEDNGRDDYQRLLTELPALTERAQSYFGRFENVDIRMQQTRH